MRVRLPGPVEVTVGGLTRQVSGLRRKAVLAMLGLHPGRIVSSDSLIEAVWERAAPVTAANVPWSTWRMCCGVSLTRMGFRCIASR